MLRNDAMQALERCDATAARMVCERLAREYPLDMSRPALQESIQPVVHRTFGDKGAAAWLGWLWQDFAQRAERLTFDAEYADDHTGAAGLDGRGPFALGRCAGDLADAGGTGVLIASAPG
ncbi:hypothetical protein [Verminephrobacter eiseniae]|nr:hypothetical protein [Verminephrobacter eiseniae]